MTQGKDKSFAINILQLARINMSMAIAFSAVAGYIFYNHAFDPGVLAVFTGVLLLAGSASAINQYQERELDSLMSRTKDRPLAAKQMNPTEAIVIATIMGLLGTLVLYFFTTPITALLGLFNILWYNGVYTPLKRKTVYVLIIGAITGAVPPLMGWTAAGGELLNKDIIFIGAFMFFWQIPHFCLLLLRFKDDYNKAGFPVLTSFMGEKQVGFIVFIWVIGTSVSTLFFPLFSIVSGTLITLFIIVLNFALILFFYNNTFRKNITFNLGSSFRSLYLYQIIILLILIVQALK